MRVRKKYNYIPSQIPPCSWLVSTGKKWPGDAKSGPTALGVFAIDERKGCIARGWHSRGMVHVMYIDYHYRSGWRSGIAFHGTTPGQYCKLGRIASHGCIRMYQSNALNLLKRVKGWDKVLTEEHRWGEVPRFWKRTRGSNRYDYVRDGSILRDRIEKPITVADASTETAGTQSDVIADAIDRLPPVLTKTGYRALTVTFRD